MESTFKSGQRGGEMNDAFPACISNVISNMQAIRRMMRHFAQVFTEQMAANLTRES